MYSIPATTAHMIRSSIGKTSVRYITIQQPSTVSTTQPVSLAIDKSDVASMIDPVNVEHIDTPTFETIGNPASSLSITIPPSVPVYVKKRSVMSVYSHAQKDTNPEKTSFIKSSWEFKKPIRRFLFSGDRSTYQKIIGTVPMQLLVSAHDGSVSKSSSVKSFVNLSLDGSYDWILFQPSALQCYTGNSLSVDVKSLPKSLHNGFKNRGYTWLNGRGLASVVGRGSVFKVGLGVGEEIRVNRNNLFALSVTDVGELNNDSVIGTELWNSMNGLFNKIKKVNDNEEPVKVFKLFNNPAVDGFISKSYEYTKKAFSFVSTTTTNISDFIIGNGNYVIVRGPRTVLIETGCSNANFVVNPFQGVEGVEKLEKYITKEEEWKKPKVVPGDNFGVVTIGGGKTSYKNIENFDEEVKRIESLKK